MNQTKGPMFGQRMYFSIFSEETVPHAIRRYEEQGATIDKLVDHLLAAGDYFLGPEYSVVDIAFYSWYFAAVRSGFPLTGHPNLEAWFERVGSRPAVRRGVNVPAALPSLPPRKRVAQVAEA